MITQLYLHSMVEDACSCDQLLLGARISVLSESCRAAQDDSSQFFDLMMVIWRISCSVSDVMNSHALAAMKLVR